MSTRTKSQTKYFNKSLYKPDPGVISALNSIKQNPKFSRLLAFSINCLIPLLTPPNPRHRENANYFISQGGLTLIINAINDHSKDDEILFNSTQLLIRLIGKGKFKDEKIACLIVQSGGVAALMNALNNTESEKTKHTIKIILELLDTLGFNARVSMQLIEQNVLETILKVLGTSQMNPLNISKGLETLCKFLGYSECKSVIMNHDLLPLIQVLLIKKSFSPVIVTVVLRLLELLSRTMEGVEYMKKNNSLEAIVSCMEKHPYEKDLLSNGSLILSRLVTMADFNNVLMLLRNNENNESSLLNISILSQLALIDDMMDEIIKQGALKDLLKIIEMNLEENINEHPEKIQLIKNCTIAVGRIIEADVKQFIQLMDTSPVNILKRTLLEIKSPEIMEVALNTLSKLAENPELKEIILGDDFVEKVVKKMEEYKGNEKCCEAFMNFLIGNAHNEKVTNSVFQKNGLENILLIMELHMNNRSIEEKGMALLHALIKEEWQAEKLMELKGFELLYKINKKHPNWRKFSLYFLILLDRLVLFPKVCPQFKSNESTIESILIILSQKNFEPVVEQPLEGGSGANENKEEQTQQIETVEKIEEKQDPNQEKEIKNVSLQILGKVVDDSNLEKFQKKLVNELIDLKQNSKGANISLEYILWFFAETILIPTLLEKILLNKAPMLIVELSQDLIKRKDFLGKSNYISLIIDFFLNLTNSSLIEPNLVEIYKKLAIEKFLLNFLYEIIQKNEEPLQILYALVALGKMLNKAITSQQKKTDKKKIYFEDFEETEFKKFMDNVIDGVMNNMKKYPDHESLQIAGLEIFNLITRMTYTYHSSLVKLGVSRFIISKLEEETTSKIVGTNCLNVLRNIGAFSKEALILMNNQKAATAIMNFLSHQGHDLLITQVATPLLKLLATVDNLEIFEELDSEIQELLKTIDPLSPSYLRSNALEALELLNNFALIESAFDLLLKNNALQSVIGLLIFESTQEEEVLIEKGELSTNDRLITSSVSFINTMMESPKTNVSKEQIAVIQENMLKIVKSSNYIPNQLKMAVKGLRSLLKSKENQASLLDQCLNQGLLDSLIEDLDRYKENSEISQEINALLLDFTRLSNDVASVLAEKDFLKILLKETRTLFKLYSNHSRPELLDRLKENLSCLKVFSLLGELPAKKLCQGGGFELCLLMLQKTLDKREDDLGSTDNNKDFRKEIRLHQLDFREEIGLASVLPEVLGLCSVLKGVKEGNDGDIELASSLLKILKGFFRTQNVALMTMKMIEGVLDEEEVGESLRKSNDMVEALWMVLNYHPLDDRVEVVAGEILFRMKQRRFEEDVMGSVLEGNFSLDLANLLTVYANRIRKSEIEVEIVSKIQEILLFIENNLPKDYNSLASVHLFISRLCRFCSPEIKTFLLKSQIPKMIIECIPEAPKEIPVFLEICLYTLNQILNFPIKASMKVDPATFDYEEIKPSFALTETLSDIFVSNQGKHLIGLMSFAENKDEGFLAINHRALELLFNCAYLHPAIAAYLEENYGLPKLQDLYEDICKRTKDLNQNTLVMKLCKLLAAMSRIQVCFDDILHNTSFLQILLSSIQNIDLNPEITLEDCCYLEEFIWCLGTFSDNNFDKAELIEKRVLECLLEKLRSINKIGLEVVYNRECIGFVAIQLLKTLKILEKDPSILRIICSEPEISKIFETMLHKMAIENKEIGELEAVSQDFKLDLIYSSENLNERTIEHMLNLLVEMTKNPLSVENLEFAKGERFFDLIDLIRRYKTNLIIVVRALKVLDSSLRAVCEKGAFKTLAEDEEKLKKMGDFIDLVEAHFGKVGLIKMLTESIRSLLEGKVDRSISEEINSQISRTLGDFGSSGLGKSFDQEIEEQAGRRKRSSAIANTTEILTKLGYVSNSFEYFVQKVEENRQTQSDLILTGKLLAAITNFATNFDKKMKLFNMGVVDSILSMVSNPKIEDSIKFGGFEFLAKVFLEKRIVWKYALNHQLIITIKNELIIINKEAYPEIPFLKRNTLKALLRIISCLSENPSILERLFGEKIIEIIMDILLANKDKIDIVIGICEALGAMAKKPHIIHEMVEFGILELLMDFFDKYLQNLPGLRSFTLLVGEIGSNSPEAQEKLGMMAFPYLITEGVKLYPQDLALTNSSCLSLSWLCYTNNKISEFLVKSEIIKPIAFNLVKNFLKEKDLMSHICLLVSNLCFKNNFNKQLLGTLGSINCLMNVLEFYIKKENIDEQTLRNCLKALGNLSLLIENSAILIKNNFVRMADSFVITSKGEYSELVKFFLDILSNLSSFPEEINIMNLLELIDQGIIELLLKCITQNELNTPVLVSAIKCLDYLCSNKSIQKYGSNLQVFGTLFKILKSQDWNRDLVIKIVRTLIHITDTEKTTLFFEAKLPQTLVDIMRVQSDSDEILIKIFRLFGKLCVDKPKAKALFNTGLIPIVFTLTEEKQFSKETIFEMFNLFSKMGKFCDQASEQICQAGFGYVRSVIEENFEEVQLVEIASLLLQNISDINTNADIILQNEGIEFTHQILQKYPKSESIVLCMFKFIQNIAETHEDYRKVCLSKNCVADIEWICAMEEAKETVKIAGARAKGSIETQNKDNLPDPSEILGMVFKFKMGQTKSLISKEKKNFLLAGRICKLYKNNGNCKNMHISCNSDFKSILAKRPMKKEEKNIWKISVVNITEAIFDFTDKDVFSKSVFAKSGGLFRKKADPELCFALVGNFPKKSEEKSFFIEAPNLIEKQKWIECLKALLDEHRRLQKQASSNSPTKIEK